MKILIWNSQVPSILLHLTCLIWKISRDDISSDGYNIRKQKLLRLLLIGIDYKRAS